jgi:hypothetical protein
MPRRHVSNDLKVRIPYLVYVEDFKVNLKEVGYLLGVKKSMIYQTLKEWYASLEVVRDDAMTARHDARGSILCRGAEINN